MATTMSTTTNSFLKTHFSLSTTTTTTTASLNIATSLFNPKPIFLKKTTKNISISLQKPVFFTTRFVTRVAQTSDWDQEGSANAVIDDEEQPAAALSWGAEEEGVIGVESGAEDEFSEPSEDAKLFVGNLPFDIDSEKLAKMFDAAGVVEISEVIYNRETDRSRGFGFVTMSTVEEADKAVEMFSSYDLNGRLLTVNKAAPRGSRPERPPREFAPSFRIYVGNLPWDVDNDRLEQLFSEHGKVLTARVVSDRETGRSRGFAFVTMASESEMNDAIGALDGQSLDGRAIRVNVAEERPRRTF